MAVSFRVFASARRSFASLAAADDVSKLAGSEVALKMMAAPITGDAVMSGVGMVTAVGSGVQGISVNDYVVSKAAMGSFRPVVKVSSKDLVVVPQDLPAEYASLLSAPATAALLLRGLKAGEVVVQSGGCSLIGQALVQLARLKGITTVSIVQPTTEEEEMVDLLKSLGGDVVVPTEHAQSHKFKALLSDLPKPSLAVAYAPALDDPALARKVTAATSVSQLRVAMDDASALDRTQLKVTAAVTGLASCVVSHGPLAKEVAGAKVLDEAAALSDAEAVAEVCAAFKANKLFLWLEKYPPADFEYASALAKDPMPGFRKMILDFEETTNTFAA
mmetsp:Transcript_49372/g.91844  ORF Transcript_49372/g.91844 Transcript_49372/m.91844 type:complete len:332 (-) Transcript_49372:180-1175(-)